MRTCRSVIKIGITLVRYAVVKRVRRRGKLKTFTVAGGRQLSANPLYDTSMESNNLAGVLQSLGSGGIKVLTQWITQKKNDCISIYYSVLFRIKDNIKCIK